MKTNLVALSLIFAAALWRIAIVFEPSFFNVAPVTALAFCGAVYFRDWRLWLVPFAALSISDLWLNHYHATQFGYTWSGGEMLLRAACLVAALGVGRLVARRRNLINLLAGTLGSALVFYFVTNTVAWATDTFYPKTLSGWCQALTVGHPEFPPTLWFFRNTLLGDLMFTGVFATVMELTAARTRPGQLKQKIKAALEAGKTSGKVAAQFGVSLPSVYNLKKAFGLVKARKAAKAKKPTRAKKAAKVEKPVAAEKSATLLAGGTCAPFSGDAPKHLWWRGI
jgi:hypothetical protein